MGEMWVDVSWNARNVITVTAVLCLDTSLGWKVKGLRKIYVSQDKEGATGELNSLLSPRRQLLFLERSNQQVLKQ